MPKQFKWVVEFTVDEVWVADGFDLTSVRARDMLARDLSFAQGREIGARIVSAPTKASIREAQGSAPSTAV